MTHSNLFHVLKYRYILGLIVTLMLWPVLSLGQANGDNLDFQGIIFQSGSSVKALAYGKAYTSRVDGLNSIGFNMAGLSDVSDVMVNVSGRYNQTYWQENQIWYPGSDYMNLSFYLEELYTLDPTYSGWWQNDLIDSVWTPDDFREPVMGEGYYSEKAADWTREGTNQDLHNISAALPLKLGNRQVVFGAEYNRHSGIHDFDRNDTHLDPHFGTSRRITMDSGDTLAVDWSRFLRKRTGTLHDLTGGLAFSITNAVRIGGGIRSVFGTTDDTQSLEKYGHFNFVIDEKDWMFAYDTLTTSITGKSTIAGTQPFFSTLLKFDHFHVGFNVAFPYELEREWTYTFRQVSPENEMEIPDSSGTDSVKLPGTYRLGLTLKPIDRLRFSLDVETTSYSNATYSREVPQTDSLTSYRESLDQRSIRFGLEYQIADFLTLIGGYQNTTALLIPYGVAIRDQGPPYDTYSVGASLSFGFGTFDVAYVTRTLKYYDAYYSNRNFTLKENQQVLIGYSLKL